MYSSLLESITLAIAPRPQIKRTSFFSLATLQRSISAPLRRPIVSEPLLDPDIRLRVHFDGTLEPLHLNAFVFERRYLDDGLLAVAGADEVEDGLGSEDDAFC